MVTVELCGSPAGLRQVPQRRKKREVGLHREREMNYCVPKIPKSQVYIGGKEREGCLGPSSKEEEFRRAREESTSHKGGGSLPFKTSFSLSLYP